MSGQAIANVSCVAVGGRGVLIAGPPGSGKSTLALALIDRGAVLVGDDGIAVEPRGAVLWAMPPPNIAGMLEIRGIGIVHVPAVAAPVCLVLTLGAGGAQLPELGQASYANVPLPALPLPVDAGALPLRAEWALRLHGLPLPPGGYAA